MKLTEKLSHPKLERVVLRPIQLTDAKICCRFINDPEIMRFISSRTTYTLEAEIKYITRAQEREDEAHFIIAKKDDGQPIGVMGLTMIDTIDNTATSGALIGYEEFWGKGYGTEAKLLLLNFAFEVLGLKKIYAKVHGANPRSKAYLEKTGYKEIECLKKYKFVKGKMVDLYTMELTREDFIPVWKKYTGE